MKKVAIGSDHAGYELKETIKQFMVKNGYEVEDCGSDGTPADYPDYGEKTALLVKTGACDCGIIICGTGIGISIAANKVDGIRCACCSDTYSAEYSRLHNDANMLAFGARVVGPGLAEKLVEVFLKTEFEGGRHAIRVGKITQIDDRYRGCR